MKASLSHFLRYGDGGKQLLKPLNVKEYFMQCSFPLKSSVTHSRGLCNYFL